AAEGDCGGSVESSTCACGAQSGRPLTGGDRGQHPCRDCSVQRCTSTAFRFSPRGIECGRQGSDLWDDRGSCESAVQISASRPGILFLLCRLQGSLRSTTRKIHACCAAIVSPQFCPA